MHATLVLVRHGEIVRPLDTSNFDRAPLSDRGRQQIEALAAAWPTARPTRIYASPLRRSIETAIVLSESFHVPILKRPCLKEWAPDESGISQPEYKALETRAWADLDYLPPSKESLGMAVTRARTCLEAIGSDNPGRGVRSRHSLLSRPLRTERRPPVGGLQGLDRVRVCGDHRSGLRPTARPGFHETQRRRSVTCTRCQTL